MNLNIKNLQEIKGDASFRKFYRKQVKLKKSIIVFAKKEKEKNLLIYDSINKLLLKNNIVAPKLYNENYKNNYIEIQDFGEKTLFYVLKKTKKKIGIFKNIILLLNKIQKIKKYKIKNFKKKNYKLSFYKKKLLFNEAKLFCDWYVPKVISKNKIKIVNKKLTVEFDKLLSKIKLSNNTFVHRDFHVSNLMFFKKQYAVIDSQDAIIGNKAYDLASLIDDVRIKTSKKLKEDIYRYYLSINKNKFNKMYFKNDFEILSIVRNIKIIGIFTRLAIRDNKKKYLNLIPYAWKLIELRSKNNPIFRDLKECLDKNFSNKIRKK